MFPSQTARLSHQLPKDSWKRQVALHDILNFRLLRAFKAQAWTALYREWIGICVMLIHATNAMDTVLSPLDVPEAPEFLATSANQQELLDESEVNTAATIPAAGESQLCTSRQILSLHPNITT